MSIHDDGVSRRERPGWLATFRNALFEAPSAQAGANPEAPPRADAIDAKPSAPTQSASAEIMTALEHAISERLGPAFAEFQLQCDALAEAIPDDAARVRVAMQVLTKKNIPITDLLAGLDAGLGALAANRDAWAHKIADRRAALERERQEVESNYKTKTAHATQEIERLQAAIETEKRSMAGAVEEQQQRLTDVEASSAELTASDGEFQATHRTLERKYGELRSKLSQFQIEKARHV